MKKQILAIAAACLALLAVSCKQDVPVDTLTVSSEKTINAKWQGATADIVFMRRDTLLLRFSDHEQGYYRKN